MAKKKVAVGFYRFDGTEIYEAQYKDKAVSVLFPSLVKNHAVPDRLVEICLWKEYLPPADDFKRVEITELEFKNKLALALTLINI